MVKQISRDEVKQHLDREDQIILVEALPEKYYNDSHLPGAIQMDHLEVNDKASSLLVGKESKVVVYCANTECQNSTKVARALDGLGYTNVYEYAEGKQDWLEAGFPIESGK